MDEKFYTIDQIADILGMHHKTIRKFITEGKLRANKVGKQWRIAGHDLSVFMEHNNVNVSHKNEVESEGIEFSTSEIGMKSRVDKVEIATVVDIHDVDIDESSRISNMLLAVMNSKDAKLSNSTINVKYYQSERNVKVMLWGDLEFTKVMLDCIEMLTENKRK
ncbi:helix-turn-helix domain-containing protein [Priestia taiwanensis]|uniref:2-hydroxyacid dehydrogenase n=1 Tax=Priestia taiwanensis TaxID=1347902 RepID=A0A917AJ70_9BACI|nr:helix-turn-helix domain-containing protein [Priestia taiwanensis]MBM7361825.1 excisionase family DNA binding protein [Priestia taiwanensis]GGE57244.1 2-hydroxyacid dehydrogenase [Priestia taiwanensis]